MCNVGIFLRLALLLSAASPFRQVLRPLGLPMGKEPA